MLQALSPPVGTQLRLLNCLVCSNCWIYCINLDKRGNVNILLCAASNGVPWHALVPVHILPLVFHSRLKIGALLYDPLCIVYNVSSGLITFTDVCLNLSLVIRIVP